MLDSPGEILEIVEPRRYRPAVTLVILPNRYESATILNGSRLSNENLTMEVLTPKAVRRSTRLRVEIPASVISLDRRRPYGERCTLLIVSAQGCGFRSSEELQVGTPIMFSGLPGGNSVTGQVASCVALGNDGQYFLVGASLYTHGNVWGIADPPEDWRAVAKSDPIPASAPRTTEPGAAASPTARKKSWPYNLFPEGGETHPGRK